MTLVNLVWVPSGNRCSSSCSSVNIAVEFQEWSVYLLYTALKAAICVSQSGQFVKVAMSADEEVQRQCQLREGTARRAEYDALVVHLKRRRGRLFITELIKYNSIVPKTKNKQKNIKIKCQYR